MSSNKKSAAGDKVRKVKIEIPSIKQCITEANRTLTSLFDAGMGTDRIGQSIQLATVFALQGKKRKARAELRNTITMLAAHTESGTIAPEQRAHTLLRVATVQAMLKGSR